MLAWTLWALVLSNVRDVVAIITWNASEPHAPGRTRLMILLLIANVQMTMVMFMRWIVFRLVMRRVSPASWAGGTRCIAGAIIVYGMIKGLEIEGFRLWSGSGGWPQFFCFADPGFVLADLFVPSRLFDYIATGKTIP